MQAYWSPSDSREYFVQVATGYELSCALTNTGKMECIGRQSEDCVVPGFADIDCILKNSRKFHPFESII